MASTVCASGTPGPDCPDTGATPNIAPKPMIAIADTKPNATASPRFFMQPPQPATAAAVARVPNIQEYPPRRQPARLASARVRWKEKCQSSLQSRPKPGRDTTTCERASAPLSSAGAKAASQPPVRQIGRD